MIFRDPNPLRDPLFDYPKVDLNPGVLLLGKSTTPGFNSSWG